MSHLIAGKGFTNLIVTNENLFFEAISEEKYLPTVNYFSFSGHRFIKSHLDIDKEEYMEIAMFLDEEALQTGNLYRF